jgi:chromate reductase, NAD(P)H dehydrogenase (quinone)
MSLNPSPHRQVRILGLSGSLRRHSYSTAVLKTLAEVLAPSASVEIFSLAGIPLYDQDKDGEHAPESVRTFKAKIAKSDGILIVTPEYNYGIPGVLKNALDWASRPAYGSVLKDKPVSIMSVSPAFTGGVRALGQLRETLAATLSPVVAGPDVVIAGAADKIGDGRLIDDAALRFALDATGLLLNEIRGRHASGTAQAA